MAARMSCGQLAVDNPSSAKWRSSCLVSMSLARWMRTQEAAQLPPAGHESSHSELRASPDRKSLFKYEFDDIRVVSDPYKAVPLICLLMLMPTRSKLGSSHRGSSVFAVPIQEPKPNRSMMEPAEDWYRCDAADEDFFNSLLERYPSTVIAESDWPGARIQIEPRTHRTWR
jgi:hypothetical protein